MTPTKRLPADGEGTTRQRAIEAATKAIALRHRIAVSDVPAMMQGPFAADAKAAFDAFLGVIEQNDELLDAARRAMHDGANALGRIAWDVDAERACLAMIAALKEGE